MQEETPATFERGMPPSAGLSDLLRQATRKLHTEAERTGFINDVLRGEATRAGYVLFLRNLHPVYEALELALARHARGPLQPLARADVFRAAALRADLTTLHGSAWGQDLPVLPMATAYAERIAASASRDGGVGLAGHAYTRYLGDLNGGQVLARLLSRGLSLSADALTFYEFPGLLPLPQLAAHYRAAVDTLGGEGRPVSVIVEEAKESFAHSIALSLEVAAHARAHLRDGDG